MARVLGIGGVSLKAKDPARSPPGTATSWAST